MPRVVIVPFEPVGNRPVDPRDTTGQTDPANVGALFAVTVVQEGERQAATAFWGCFSPNTVRSKTIERVDNGASDAGQFQAKLMTFGQDQAGEEPAMVGSQTTKLPIRNARRPNQDQNSSSSLNSVGTGSGLSPRRRYPKARYSPVSNVLRWSVSCANSRGSPQPKYLSAVRCLPLITTIGGYLICSGAVCWSSRRFHVSAVDLAQGTSVLSQGTVTELLSFSLRIINHDSNKHGFRSISYSNRPFCRRCGGCCRPRLPPPRARSRVSYRRRRSCRGTLCCAVSTRSDNVTPVPRARSGCRSAGRSLFKLIALSVLLFLGVV